MSDDDLDLPGIARILLRQWQWMLFGPAAVGTIALGITFLIAPTFTASTTLMPPAQQSSSSIAAIAGALGGLAGAAMTKSPVDQYVSLLKSRNVANAIITRFNLKELYAVQTLQETRDELAKNVVVTAGKKDGLVNIDVSDHDPQRAADMANAYAEELRRINKEFAVGEASQRRVFFETQMKSARDTLSDADAALNASGVSAQTMNVAPQTAVASVARLKAAVSVQELKIVSLRSFAGEENPSLKQANNELAALRAQLALVEKGSPDGSDQSKYMEKYREFKYREVLFEMVAKQYEIARLDEARDGTIIQVVDAAAVPEKKSAPKRLDIAAKASLVAALIIAFGVVLSARGLLRFPSRREPHVD